MAPLQNGCLIGYITTYTRIYSVSHKQVHFAYRISGNFRSTKNLGCCGRLQNLTIQIFISIVFSMHKLTANGWPFWIFPRSNFCIMNIFTAQKLPDIRYINTYQVFLSIANSITIVNTCSSIARVWNCSTSKTQNSSSFFLVEYFIMQ